MTNEDIKAGLLERTEGGTHAKKVQKWCYCKECALFFGDKDYHARNYPSHVSSLVRLKDLEEVEGTGVAPKIGGPTTAEKAEQILAYRKTGMTFQQIGDKMGMTEAAIGYYIYKVAKKMKKVAAKPKPHRHLSVIGNEPESPVIENGLMTEAHHVGFVVGQLRSVVNARADYYARKVLSMSADDKIAEFTSKIISAFNKLPY